MQCQNGQGLAPSRFARVRRMGFGVLLVTAGLLGSLGWSDEVPLARKSIEFRSSVDGTAQKTYVIEPEQPHRNAVLVVSLHSWSADLEQRNAPLEKLVHQRGWYYLFPNFRGANRTPQACGSRWAQQDILDAVDWALRTYRIDPNRVVLTGNSGGGHMTMLMAARYPRRWRAASAWVGISDLVAWHKRHQGSKYGDMMESVFGGPPQASQETEQAYRERSPLTHMAGARQVPLDIAAGIHDGHTGSVPVTHSILAFNAIAKANGDAPVTPEEIRQLSVRNGRLVAPHPGDEGTDATFGREFYLRRVSGKSRLTLFEGGHEGIASAAMAWFDKHLEE